MFSKWSYKSRLNSKQAEDIKRAVQYTNNTARKNWRVKS